MERKKYIHSSLIVTVYLLLIIVGAEGEWFDFASQGDWRFTTSSRTSHSRQQTHSSTPRARWDAQS